MALAADYRLPLSPGNRDSTSCSALYRSPESVLDLDSFEYSKAATIMSPTTCRFYTSDHLARATEPLSPPLNTRLASLEEFDAKSAKSFDELLALVGTYGFQRVYDQLGPEIATETSLVESSGIVGLEIVTMPMLLEAADSVEELILWLAIVKLEIGKIKEWRYAKRGDGTRRHGRPPDLTFPAPSAPPPSRTPPPATTTLCPL